MTSETFLTVVLRKRTSYCFIQSFWRERFIASGDIKSRDGRIKTDYAFVKPPIPFQNPRLRTGSEAPTNRQSNSVMAVSHGVSTFVALRRNFICVSASTKCQL